MAEDDTTNVARGRLHSGRAKLSEFVTNQICYVFGSLAEVTTADTAPNVRVRSGRIGASDEAKIQYELATGVQGYEVHEQPAEWSKPGRDPVFRSL